MSALVIVVLVLLLVGAGLAWFYLYSGTAIDGPKGSGIGASKDLLAGTGDGW